MSKHITQREMRQILYGDVPAGATAFDELRAMVSDSDEPPSDDPVRLGILMARSEQEPAPAPASMEPMFGLTVKQPWAWAICYAGKRLENRDWLPRSTLRGKRIAIHAGKGLDESGFHWLYKRGLITVPLPKETRERGSIVALATYDGAVGAGLGETTDIWFTGRYGWVLKDVQVLPSPVPCRGALGLWRVPEDVQIEVMSQVDIGPKGKSCRQNH